MTTEYVSKLTNISKSYGTGTKAISVLTDVHMAIREGEMSLIMGPSGAGKSTLLNMMGLLETPTSGEMYIGGVLTSQMNEKERARLRAKTIGFVFQEFNLFPNLSALENVIIPMLLHKEISKKEREKRARDLLDSVGMSHRIRSMPSELSGGEKQRVSIARSLATNPRMILADEPTGNVDEENELKIIEIFKGLTASGMSVVVVSHNTVYKQHVDRSYILKQGTIQEEVLGGET